MKCFGFWVAFCLCGSILGQTARITFLTPEANRPVYSERVEMYSKMSMLFGGNWTAPGLAIGVLAPVGTTKNKNYFQVGGQVASYYQASTPFLDLNAVLRVLYPVGLPEGEGFLSLYLQFQVGPSVYFNKPANWGYNLTVIPGVRYIFENHWGIFTEFGYAFHTLISGSNLNQNIHGGLFSLGATYEF